MQPGQRALAGAPRLACNVGSYSLLALRSESGGNNGSHFNINRYNDSGALIDTPFTINRTTGVATFSQTPVFSAGGYLPLSGGAMTGAMTLNGNATAALQPVPLQQLTSSIAGAGYLPLTGGTLTGGLAGTTGAFSGGLSCTGTVSAAGGTLTGSLSMASVNPAIVLQKSASGGGNFIYGYTGANVRWAMQLGDAATESGGSVGSNFSVSRYTDVGAYIDTPFTINRSTGAVNVAPVASSTNSSQSFVAGARGLTVGAGDGISYGANGTVIEFSLAAGNVLSVNRRTGNGSAISFYQQNTSCGSITLANSTTTAYNTTSDVRLKRDEHDFDAGPILDATQVYNFEWTSAPGVRAYGVMAQEAIEVFPDAVTHIEHEDSWAVDYSKFVPLLLQEIKDLRARVAALEGTKP